MRDVIGRMRWGMMGGGYAEICGICGTDHLPEIGPAGLPFLDQPPPLAKVGDRNGKRSTSQKKECLFCI